MLPEPEPEITMPNHDSILNETSRHDQIHETLESLDLEAFKT